MRSFIKFLTLPVILAALALPARATITLTFQAEDPLQGGSTSSNVLANSLVLVVAEKAAGGFAPLSYGAIGVGAKIGPAFNDVIVAQLAISSSSFFSNGENTLDSTAVYTLSGDWAAGDPLAIYWIPTLSPGATNVGLDVAYGMYTDQVGLDGSAAWITPASGAAITMLFSTTGVYGNNNGSNAPASAGYSSFDTVVPEPSDFGLIGGASALALAFYRGRKVA
jgi:hypothetical protein